MLVAIWEDGGREKGHTHVTTQDVLDLFLLETTFDDEAADTVDASRCTHFGEHELNDVLGLYNKTKRKRKV